MVFVCNLRSIHSLANVVILFAIKTSQPCQLYKPIARVYTIGSPKIGVESFILMIETTLL